MNLYSALELGKNSLLAQQQIFQIIGHNIANVNTKGYTRQVGHMSPVAPPPGTTQLSSGRGVDLSHIFAVRSQFIDNQIIERSRNQGKYENLSQHLGSVEALFSEAGGLGVSSQLSRFFNNWGDLANNPTDLPTRRNLIDQTRAFTAHISNTYTRLTEQQEIQNESLNSTIQSINALGREIASLNEKISYAQGSGQSPNDLIDRRSLKVRELSELIGINVYPNSANGSLTIEIAGRTFVHANELNQLGLQRNPANDNYYDITIAQFGSTPLNITADIRGGRVEAALLVRDTYIPDYKRQLDNFSYGLIRQVNDLHAAGFALDGSTTGTDFFVDFVPAAPGDYRGVSLFLEINPALISNPELIAASGLVDPGPPPAGAPGDNSNALALAALANADNVIDADNDGTFDYGTFHDYLHSLLSSIGNQTSLAKYEQEANQGMLLFLENRRDEISGVSLDEEAATLMQFEKSYQAMAQYLGLVNRLLDVLIQVGR